MNKKPTPPQLSFEDFAALTGVVTDAPFLEDFHRLPGATVAMNKRVDKDAQRRLDDHREKLDHARAEYARQLDEGTILPPDQIETLAAVARGHPDRASTTAAKRTLAKRFARNQELISIYPEIAQEFKLNIEEVS